MNFFLSTLSIIKYEQVKTDKKESKATKIEVPKVSCCTEKYINMLIDITGLIFLRKL